jgi:tetratricopeptide (TPR) repeat protein
VKLLLTLALAASCVFSPCVVAQQDQQDKTALVARAFDAFYNLEYEPALADFEKALATDPADPTLHNHVAQTLLFRELFRNGALESEIVDGTNAFVRRPGMEPSPEVERRFLAEIELTIKLSNERLARTPRDSTTLHTMAVAYGFRANYNFLVHKAWTAALSDASKAQKLDREVTTLDPANYDARLILGVYDYVTGSLPWHVRTLARIAGYHGDKQRGIATLEEVAEKGRESRNDADILLCALYRREGQPKRSIPRVLALTARFPRNYLIRFELAQMCAAAGLRADALGVMNEIAQMKADNAPGYHRVSDEKIAYETGNLQFWFGDLEAATANLRKIADSPDGMKSLNLNTGALTLLRLGQIYDLRHQHAQAVEWYQRGQQFAPNADASRTGKRYIGTPYRRSA